jgi:hypothetical protein
VVPPKLLLRARLGVDHLHRALAQRRLELGRILKPFSSWMMKPTGSPAG